MLLPVIVCLKKSIKRVIEKKYQNIQLKLYTLHLIVGIG